MRSDVCGMMSFCIYVYTYTCTYTHLCPNMCVCMYIHACVCRARYVNADARTTHCNTIIVEYLPEGEKNEKISNRAMMQYM